MIQENQNNGVKIRELRVEDYKTGSTEAPYKIILDSGDWNDFKPANEMQSGPGGDKYVCVTASSAAAIETTLNYFYRNNLLAEETKVWLESRGFVKNGVVGISTTWAAIQNGTDEEGNYAEDVAQWWRKNGFIPEAMLPNNQNLTWQQYYDKSRITDEMRKVALESKEHFRIFYEWVIGNNKKLKEELRRGPIQVLTPVCPGWNTKSPVPTCSQKPQHATESLFVEPVAYIVDIFDTYSPFNKKLAADYPLNYKMLYIVKPLKEKTMSLLKQKDSPDIFMIMGGKKILIADQKSYERLGSPEYTEVIEEPTYPFGGSLVVMDNDLRQ